MQNYDRVSGSFLLHQKDLHSSIKYLCFMIDAEVEANDTRVVLGGGDAQVILKVLDDGQVLLTDKIISVFLTKTAGGTTNDILVSEATLIIRAAKGEDNSAASMQCAVVVCRRFRHRVCGEPLPTAPVLKAGHLVYSYTCAVIVLFVYLCVWVIGWVFFLFILYRLYTYY